MFAVLLLDSRWMLEPSEWTTAHEAIRIRAERRDRQVRGQHRAARPRRLTRSRPGRALLEPVGRRLG